MVHRYSIDSTGRPWRHPEGLYVWHSDFDALADELAEAKRIIRDNLGSHWLELLKARTADSAPAVRRCIYCDVPETEWSRVPLCCAPDGNGHIAPRVRSTADAVQQEDR